ncbi:hypothetical protein BT93_L2711 [Corymbia citriodora subsp. variegata]|uniref:Uncharacterized protein n=1 Tax=Corymbia citriodora subsp. variegata TaxID=360336 RepID=A0A8T0CIV0_CORYI|nr:hypothetical protein BT93_L2711 [Corymbia citriodora subsp. variegata]
MGFDVNWKSSLPFSWRGTGAICNAFPRVTDLLRFFVPLVCGRDGDVFALSMARYAEFMIQFDQAMRFMGSTGTVLVNRIDMVPRFFRSFKVLAEILPERFRGTIAWPWVLDYG